MDTGKVAVIVGVGPGLGCALAQRFARAEMHVALVARDVKKLEGLAADCTGVHHAGRAYGCDATDEAAVEALFQNIRSDLGEPDLVVYNAGRFAPAGLLDTSREEFERCWRVGCLGGFLVGRAAARGMVARIENGGAGGTILFTGATASLRGSAGFHNLAVGKFGLRALAQSMARELQPKGIHVAHVVLDGHIRPQSPGELGTAPNPDDMLDPAAIAEAYYQLYRQPRSAWTHELDLRPWTERF
ncbi:SDR family NAD(P)-dependent oxidoreductase [Pseudogulbenkiania ferrooxidans]|uniref:Short-chain dehydrogenase/reductase SDR n=1 Tax=Pseudogulbenkiania ferrooxidans 2002 TaxID=279714 RepID=B9Z3U2_9NEIS|nr:SDR family NAD(P)-dependent oxidoreductase [Pseudogulbenkiania ferrooxidans]EEG08519.1 short-chain dehydrogenase/reductase SDR [Pseudogulbenkiania ferrooxidans 2002]